MRYIRSAAQVTGIPAEAAATLEEVSKRYVFRANDYYLNLIDWNDPKDPIRQLVIPRKEELIEWGDLDASKEAANTVVQGVQHKYRDTGLILVNSVCGAYCRYCFRKRLFMDDNDDAIHDLEAAFQYVGSHPEITDVLLTGGDPLIMNTAKLRGIVSRIAAMPHVKTIRIGSKMPAFNPFRITDDPSLLEMFREFSTSERAIYLMAHFDHPRELTKEARAGIKIARENHVRVVNQCPVIRGINDDPEILATLFQEMTVLGAPQYYLFQCRPTAGNEAYEMPLVEGWKLFSEAQRRCSGLSRRARYCMSHASGKIEMLGLDDSHIYLRYHRAKNPADEGRVMVCHRDDHAYWFDQLTLVSEQRRPSAPRAHYTTMPVGVV
ncbi:MAG: KamA family radical SAM protein [Candidatus Eisenbacteria bacterium]